MEYIYVLELYGKKYYVGKTNSPMARIISHLESEGSQWTKKYKPKEIIEVKKKEFDFEEDQVTLKYIKLYGIDNVRGGSFTQLVLTDTEKNMIYKMLHTESDACFKCGSIDHFARECDKNVNDNNDNHDNNDNNNDGKGSLLDISKFGSKWTDEDTKILCDMYADKNNDFVKIAEKMSRGKKILIKKIIENNLASDEREIRGIDLFDKSDYAKSIKNYYKNHYENNSTDIKTKNQIDAKSNIQQNIQSENKIENKPDKPDKPILQQNTSLNTKKGFFGTIIDAVTAIGTIIAQPPKHKRYVRPIKNTQKTVEDLQKDASFDASKDTPKDTPIDTPKDLPKDLPKDSNKKYNKSVNYVCYRCGRSGHFKGECYATKHVDGYFLKKS